MGSFSCMISTAALFRSIALESTVSAVKSLPCKSLVPMVLLKPASARIADIMISALAGLPFQLGAGVKFQSSVIGDEVRVIAATRFDCNRSFLITSAFLFASLEDGMESRLLGL